MKKPRILVIHKRSKYAAMVSGARDSVISRLVQEKDSSVAKMVKAHDAHRLAMTLIEEVLDERGIDATWRYDFSGLIPDSYDLVLTVGGDGTVLHASHSIGNTPVLAINSSPQTSVGYFTAGPAENFSEIIEKMLQDQLPTTTYYRMEVKVNGEVVNSRVLNDVLFSHDCPASTTRYVLHHGNQKESQMSSGVWVSTAAGSTAAIQAAGGVPMEAGLQKIQYAVREPGPSGGSESFHLPNMTKGMVATDEILAIKSKSTSAKLYVDGPHVVIPVNFGDIVTFSGGAAPIYLLGDLNKNKS